MLVVKKERWKERWKGRRCREMMVKIERGKLMEARIKFV